MLRNKQLRKAFRAGQLDFHYGRPLNEALSHSDATVQRAYASGYLLRKRDDNEHENYYLALEAQREMPYWQTLCKPFIKPMLPRVHHA
jgi:hypothetical protein